MKHNWESRNPAPRTKWFKFFGCHDLRECTNCGAVQVLEVQTSYGRVDGYRWYPLVGRCKGEKVYLACKNCGGSYLPHEASKEDDTICEVCEKAVDRETLHKKLWERHDNI